MFSVEIYSEHLCNLLSRQEVESLLALHAFLLVGIVRRESGGVSRHSGLVIAVVEFEGVDSLSLFVEVISQIHFITFYLIIIMIRSGLI